MLKNKIIKYLMIVMLLSSLTQAADVPVWLGFSFTQVKLSANTYGKHPAVTALVVDGMFPESDAMNCGLKAEDAILGVNGKYLTNGLQILKKIVKNAKPGTKVKLMVGRPQGRENIVIKLTKRPADIRSFMGSNIGSKTKELGENFYANKQNLNKKAKVTILDFWATWCAPCRHTLPILNELYGKYSNHGLEVVGISTEKLNVLKNFNIKSKLNYPLYNDISGLENRRYGVKAIPTMLIVDSDGYVVETFVGSISKLNLEQAIRKYLK